MLSLRIISFGSCIYADLKHSNQCNVQIRKAKQIKLARRLTGPTVLQCSNCILSDKTYSVWALFLSVDGVCARAIWLSNISLWFEYCFFFVAAAAGIAVAFLGTSVGFLKRRTDEYLNARLTKESKIKHFNQLFTYSMNQTHTTESATAHWFYADFPGSAFLKFIYNFTSDYLALAKEEEEEGKKKKRKNTEAIHGFWNQSNHRGNKQQQWKIWPAFLTIVVDEWKTNIARQ